MVIRMIVSSWHYGALFSDEVSSGQDLVVINGFLLGSLGIGLSFSFIILSASETAILSRLRPQYHVLY